jgi:hypothetical protein
MTTTQIDIIKNIRGTDDSRFVFNGIYYHDTKNEVAATDGRMLVVGREEGFKIYIPSLAGKVLHPENLEIIDGTYPDYNSILDTARESEGKKYQFFFPAQKKVSNDPIYLYGKKGGFDPNDSTENLSLSLEEDETRADKLVCMLNGKYLNKAYVKMGRNEAWGLEMKISASDRPIHFKLIDHKGNYQWENLDFVLMPMKLPKK